MKQQEFETKVAIRKAEFAIRKEALKKGVYLAGVDKKLKKQDALTLLRAELHAGNKALAELVPKKTKAKKITYAAYDIQRIVKKKLQTFKSDLFDAESAQVSFEIKDGTVHITASVRAK